MNNRLFAHQAEREFWEIERAEKPVPIMTRKLQMKECNSRNRKRDRHCNQRRAQGLLSRCTLCRAKPWRQRSSFVQITNPYACPFQRERNPVQLFSSMKTLCLDHIVVCCLSSIRRPEKGGREEGRCYFFWMLSVHFLALLYSSNSWTNYVTKQIHNRFLPLSWRFVKKSDTTKSGTELWQVFCDNWFLLIAKLVSEHSRGIWSNIRVPM